VHRDSRRTSSDACKAHAFLKFEATGSGFWVMRSESGAMGSGVMGLGVWDVGLGV